MTETNNRWRSLEAQYGQEKFSRIRDSKILIIGAGGIGCELLKNLAYSGVRYIELIDLDTIDVSNLNRQFLFRPEHVGKPKAIVAGEIVKSFNKELEVVSHYDNIKSPQFSTIFYEKFNVVLNALDNLDARRHVNRLCLAANVPLIDSGTTGYLGQVMPILKGKTSCYECFPKQTQKVYPICTIRSTPDKPVHCIVWAKECFRLIFGASSESMLFEDTNTDESTYMHLIHDGFPSDKSITTLLEHGKAVLIALYDTEIQKRIGMDVYKTAKMVPQSLSASTIEEASIAAREVLENPSPSSEDGDSSTAMQTNVQSATAFLMCLYDACIGQDSGLMGTFSFDKDDEWAMRFVTAASNLRSGVFGIPLLSLHDAKGIAGNIIPAIATTNAIVAGVQVIQALNFITADGPVSSSGGNDSTSGVPATGTLALAHLDTKRFCPHTYCFRLPTRRGVFLQPSAPELPQNSCYICGTDSLTLQIDTDVTTLGDLVDKVVKGKLSVNEPSVMMGTSFLYEEGEDADEDLASNLKLTLKNCPAGGVIDGCELVVHDFTQRIEVRILVKHLSSQEMSAMGDGPAADLFILEGQQAIERQRQAKIDKLAEEEEQLLAQASSSSSDSIRLVKRKLDDSFAVEGDGVFKRKKDEVAVDDDDDIIIL
jgi:ubiquitin-like 1-activating enzyme E1 B